jgi:hypothetical protein
LSSVREDLEKELGLSELVKDIEERWILFNIKSIIKSTTKLPLPLVLLVLLRLSGLILGFANSISPTSKNIPKVLSEYSTSQILSALSISVFDSSPLILLTVTPTPLLTLNIKANEKKRKPTKKRHEITIGPPHFPAALGSTRYPIRPISATNSTRKLVANIVNIWY